MQKFENQINVDPNRTRKGTGFEYSISAGRQPYTRIGGRRRRRRNEDVAEMRDFNAKAKALNGSANQSTEYDSLSPQTLFSFFFFIYFFFRGAKMGI